MYADAFGLLVLTALVTSDSLSKNRFFDRLKMPLAFASGIWIY